MNELKQLYMHMVHGKSTYSHIHGSGIADDEMRINATRCFGYLG